LKLLNRCYRITDSGLKDLSEGLKRLVSLKNVNLNFQCCFQISHRGLVSIIEALKTIVPFQTLNLNLVGCTRITEKSLKKIMKGLSQLVSLTSMGLDFSRCKVINDESMKSIVECLNMLVSLQTISLSVKNCKEITDDGVKSMSENLRKLDLHSVSVNFWKSNRGRNLIDECTWVHVLSVWSLYGHFSLVWLWNTSEGKLGIILRCLHEKSDFQKSLSLCLNCVM